MTSISGQTDAPEVRCGLTDTHTHRQTNTTTVTLAAHARRGLITAIEVAIAYSSPSNQRGSVKLTKLSINETYVYSAVCKD